MEFADVSKNALYQRAVKLFTSQKSNLEKHRNDLNCWIYLVVSSS